LAGMSNPAVQKDAIRTSLLVRASDCERYASKG
jgi:hypothetical protein